MPALPTEEAKEFYRLVAVVGEVVVRQHIAPKTAVNQLTPEERAALLAWLRERADGTGDGHEPA